MSWIKSVWNLVPTIIGVIQNVLPTIKELAIAVVRIIAALPFAWSVADPIIDKINDIYEVIDEWVERIKNALLLIP